ncbi:PREDICTED: zinc finger BED domain-containing protein 1-like [Amphimedon queenslandica]|uniref:BED-type domain-containing protein n=1 Tax=Amphimedon queenslandica TaxID=400682 RepID=A0A1X7UCW0_AMPQE|nr:PREDICTED: zinc finger BED domain-containing protein 1-like [Amphimedon queenslandica]|eukprot:XP_003388406.1 PREDICTED: zinc finger BED domain-containing protein 1-like [Amphimedon queenslandica]
MATKRTRSSVWNHFEKADDPEYAVCLVQGCKTKIKQSCGNTSNLLKHLKTKHGKEHQECMDEMKASTEKRRKTTVDLQPTLAQTLSSTTPYPKDSARKQKLDKAVMSMIITDLQPMSIVSDPGFQNLVETLDKRYVLPSRPTITRRLPELYSEVKAKLQTELDKSATHIAVTTDIWTSLQTKSYCCVTAHYITPAWELKSVLLETFEFNTEHTASHIAAELNRVTTGWNINGKIICAVTDNASNMVAAIRETGWRHLPCFAHSLSLVVQDAMKADEDLYIIKNKCKDIVSHFHRSAKSSDRLRNVQKQLEAPEHKLVQEVCTRWNSTYLMFERYVKQHEAITAALCFLGHNDLCLSTDEVTKISHANSVLAPFLEATENISGDHYVSVSMILPLKKLLHQQSSSQQSSSTLAKILADEIHRRFSSLETSYVTSATALLDPRFKKIPFSSSTYIEQTTNRIVGEMAALPTTADSLPDDQSESDAHVTSSSLWSSFDEKVAQSTSHRTPATECIIEIRRYFEEPNIERSFNPLEWWKANAIRFPRLSKIAAKYLCIPGSSVPSERLFSKAGQLVSERRNRIKPKNIDMILFLNHNIKLV